MVAKGSPDEVCGKYFDRGVKIAIIVENDMVYIEGSSLDLQFIGELILAQANFDKDDGFFIPLDGEGFGLLDDSSTHGIYIQRLDK
jgi:hypothetical protein